METVHTANDRARARVIVHESPREIHTTNDEDGVADRGVAPLRMYRSEGDE